MFAEWLARNPETAATMPGLSGHLMTRMPWKLKPRPFDSILGYGQCTSIALIHSVGTRSARTRPVGSTRGQSAPTRMVDWAQLDEPCGQEELSNAFQRGQRVTYSNRRGHPDGRTDAALLDSRAPLRGAAGTGLP